MVSSTMSFSISFSILYIKRSNSLGNFYLPILIHYYIKGVVLSTANSSNRPLLPKRRKKNSRKSAQFDPASATINRIRGQVLFMTILKS